MPSVIARRRLPGPHHPARDASTATRRTRASSTTSCATSRPSSSRSDSTRSSPTSASLRRLHVRPIVGGGRTATTDQRPNSVCSAAWGSGATSSSRSWPPRSPSPVVDGRLVEGAGVVWVSPALEAAVAGRTAGARPLGRRSGDRREAAETRSALGARPGQGRRGDAGRARGPSMASTLVAYAHGEDKREVTTTASSNRSATTRPSRRR
jgi:hypothetical protein